MDKIFILIIISIFATGCAWTMDLPRTLWGSSIRVLSDKRDEAETQFFPCAHEKCFDAVVSMTVPYRTADMREGQLILFKKDPKRRYLIIMGVPGSVDTTEVGIFFDVRKDGTTQVDISSLSSRARETAARMVFPKLADMCQPAL